MSFLFTKGRLIVSRFGYFDISFQYFIIREHIYCKCLESGFVAFNFLYMQFLNCMDLIIPFVTHSGFLCLQ